MIKNDNKVSSKKPKALISKCLCGFKCRYDGKIITSDCVKKLSQHFDLIPICPEMLGGLKCPRTKHEVKLKENEKEIKLKPNQIISDLTLNFNVISETDKDNTQAFISGSKMCYNLAVLHEIKYAFLKEKSPSCGVKNIYDGTFSKKLIESKGILATLLSSIEGMTIISDTDVDSFLEKYTNGKDINEN